MSFDIDLSRRIGDATVATRFTTPPGLTVLFGPSGAGKTSILNMVAGLMIPDTGHVRVAGDTLFEAGGINVAPEHRRSGYVFQDARLFPHRRVEANLHYGERRAPADAPGMSFDAVVAFLGIGHLLTRWPRGLSGGEARRVAIGRALLSRPRFLLMDEPLSSLDAARREEIMAVIERIRDDLALPILYVTHDAQEAERLATTVIPVQR